MGTAQTQSGSLTAAGKTVTFSSVSLLGWVTAGRDLLESGKFNPRGIGLEVG